MQFIVRMSDGRSFAQTLDAGGRPGTVLLRGGTMVGPAGAPFGFYRRTPLPGSSLAPPATPPPSADPVKTIATVTAVDRAYDLIAEGTVEVDGYACYRLELRPLRDPAVYPLRELLVDRTSYQIIGLTYAQPFNATFAIVHYRFAPVGTPPVWSIVHIDAEAAAQRVSQDLHDITFPAQEPAGDFQP